MCQSCDKGLDSLYCGKWRKMSHHDLDLDRTMPNLEIVRAIFIYYNMFKWFEPLFFELSCTQTDRPTDRQTDRHTHIHTHTHTHTHKRE